MTSPTPDARPTLSGGGRMRNFTFNDMKAWNEAANPTTPTSKSSKTRKTVEPPPPPQSEGEAPDPMLADETEAL